MGFISAIIFSHSEKGTQKPDNVKCKGYIGDLCEVQKWKDIVSTLFEHNISNNQKYSRKNV